MAREFDVLALNGHNYLIWAMDIKIALASSGLVRAIQAPDVLTPAGVTPLTLPPIPWTQHTLTEKV